MKNKYQDHHHHSQHHHQLASMEDLWNDITLTYLHHQSPAPTTHHHRRSNHFRPTFTTAIFQDFLVHPFNPSFIAAAVPGSITDSLHHHVPPTILSLTTADAPPELQLGDSTSGYSTPPPPHPHGYTSETLPQLGKRSFQESESDELNLGTSERRNKRMIKNRESADRSRARKQAYTNELELEVARLKQENARLRMEQEMRNRTVLDHSPKKHKLHRSLTAPF